MVPLRYLICTPQEDKAEADCVLLITSLGCSEAYMLGAHTYTYEDCIKESRVTVEP